MNNNNNIPNTKLLMWGGIPLSLFLAHLILYFLNPESTWWDFYIEEGHWNEIGLSLLTGIAIYAIIFGIINYISKWLDGNTPLNNNLLVHFLATTSVVVVCMFILIYIEGFLYEDFLYEGFGTGNIENTTEMEQAFQSYLVVNMIVAAFINSLYNLYTLFECWKAAMIQSNELNTLSHELKETALKAELNMLKSQLDPHFLFNNFSMLTQLIETDKENAQLFLQNLSKVYRYVLANSKKDMISLEDELRFVENYFHLIKIRHGEAVHLHISVDKADKQKGIPPVTLQLLIENAIKHNIASVKQPLSISVASAEDGFIIVKNNLQRININYPGTGLGLTNITNRYQLLEGINPEVFESNTEFTVKLPLLNF